MLAMADTPTSGDRLKLFISYSRRDMAAADALEMYTAVTNR